MLSDGEVRRQYGPSAIITRRVGFVLVHLDDPPGEVVRARTEDFDPDLYFDPDCPLCGLQRARGVVVFDELGRNDEEILLE